MGQPTLGSPITAKAPRIVILVITNYLEIAIAFGIIGFLQHYQPYYIVPGQVQVVDGIRASIGVLTPLGVPSVPQTWSAGTLFYFEYVLGLLFLVVVINVVLTFITREKSPDLVNTPAQVSTSATQLAPGQPKAVGR